MTGLNPLSYETIEAWSRLTGRELDRREVEALLQLDAVLLMRRAEPETTEPATPPVDAWPEKRDG